MKQKKNRWSRWVIIAAVAVFAGLIAAAGMNWFVIHQSGKDIVSLSQMVSESEKKADAVVVLGAKVSKDGKMSLMLKERVDLGIKAYKQGLADRIIMSGDHGTEGYDEVSTMKAYAKEQGVPSEHIFKDHAGFSTYETMYRARDVFKVRSMIVVTQKYHLYRAVYDARGLGLSVKGIACDKAVYKGDRARKFREFAARLKDVGYIAVQPKPKYLGKAIPVSGNGNVTD